MQEKLNQTQQQVVETKATKTKKVDGKIKLPIRPPYFNETKLINALQEVSRQINLLCQILNAQSKNKIM